MPGMPGPDARILARVWELHVQHKTRDYIRFTIAEEFPEQWPEPPSRASITNWTREAGLHAEAEHLLDHALEKARHLSVVSTVIMWLMDRQRQGVKAEDIAKHILPYLKERALLLGLYAPTRVAVESALAGPPLDADTIEAIRQFNIESDQKMRALESADKD